MNIDAENRMIDEAYAGYCSGRDHAIGMAPALTIRMLIAQMEMLTVLAQKDLAVSGQWSCDYMAWQEEIMQIIQHIKDEYGMKVRGMDYPKSDEG